MRFGILAGTAIAILAIVAAVLIGLTPLFSRRGRLAPPLLFYAGGSSPYLTMRSWWRAASW